MVVTDRFHCIDKPHLVYTYGHRYEAMKESATDSVNEASFTSACVSVCSKLMTNYTTRLVLLSRRCVASPLHRLIWCGVGSSIIPANRLINSSSASLVHGQWVSMLAAFLLALFSWSSSSWKESNSSSINGCRQTIVVHRGRLIFYTFVREQDIYRKWDWVDSVK